MLLRLPARTLLADALKQLEDWREQGHEHLLESDIESCFDSIDRELLLAMLSRHVPDARLLELVERWMEAGTLWLQQPTTADGAPGSVTPKAIPLVSPRGIPQGSVLSPLLCNLFLDAFADGVALAPPSV